MLPVRRGPRWGCCCMASGRCRCAASVCCVRWGLRWLCGGSGRADSGPLCWRAAVRWPPWACALHWAPAAGRSWRCSARRTPCWRGCWGWHCGVARPKNQALAPCSPGPPWQRRWETCRWNGSSRGGGVRGGGAGAVQPGTAGGGTGLQRDAGRGPLCRGPGPCLWGRRACLQGRLPPAFWPRAAGWKRPRPMRAAA